MKFAPEWSVIIPFKAAGTRKTRLAPGLSVAERDRISETMFWRVFAALSEMTQTIEIALLSSERLVGWTGLFLEDGGATLNDALRHARTQLGGDNLLVLQADLPFVTPADIAALLAAPEPGCSIAPDRHSSGTNAIALRSVPEFGFGFGPASLQRHSAAARGRARLVDRPGLAFDIDTPADLELAMNRGFVF